MSAPGTVVSAPRTGASEGLLVCHECEAVTKLPAVAIARGLHDFECPRCGAALHARKPNSLARTWALVIAATICYVPANLYPIMAITSLGKTQADTILSGVFFLLHHGMWPLALVVFVASFVVPLAKIISIVFLLVSVQIGSDWRPADRTRLYRITEAVGRWSMVDIYVVTILVALVKLGSLASVEARAGAVFFGAVVILTMLAAESFDPRLIWTPIDTAARESTPTPADAHPGASHVRTAPSS